MRPCVVVADASPLIFLAAVGRLDLLRSLYGKVATPPAVWREIAAGGDERPGYRAVRDAPWIERTPLRAPERIPTAAGLDCGEAEAIALYRELNAELLLTDDGPARRYALRDGIIVLGTAGVLIDAKRSGLIREVAGVLADVRRAGLYLSEIETERALRLAGELP